ncbi:uncharacterized protein LOC6525499 [Drosophila yakuba]|uniref:Uncharacterized protein n=1 Tax=Drosophila yakuba TaxID=7245 RepID=B4Q1F3_DROYA|nr:uncharacterized protein LOC6525499 [Drosophila yakuba]EDX02442.2 uncharacterized protein Dyak_GE15683 [Drosophila yakuba]
MVSPGVCAAFFSVLVLISYIAQVRTELSAAEVAGDPSAAQLLPSSCRHGLNGSSSGPEIRLPFVDMMVRHERPLFVLREPEEDLVLLLHGAEIYQLHVATGERRLVPLGNLAGQISGRRALGADVVAWREFLLFAIVLDESMEVYQLPKELLLSEDPATQLSFEPLQEFSLPGAFLQLHLLKPSGDQVLLLVASNHTRSHSKCRTFEWLDTYFNPLEEITLPAIRVLQVVGRQPLYIIFGRSLRGSQSKLVLTVYELDRNSRILQQRQALTVQAQSVQAARFRGRNCLIACGSSASASCIFFRMVDGQFVVYRKHARKDLSFRRLSATKKGQLLIGARANGEVIVFSSTRLDCYSGFQVAGEAEPSGLLIHKNLRNETFLLLAYRRSSSDLIRTVQLGGVEEASNQVGAAPDEDLSVVQLHRHEFEESINALRGLLLRRRSSTEKLRNLVDSLKEKSPIQLDKPLHLLPQGHIGRLQLVDEHLRTPTQLKQRLEELRQRVDAMQTRRTTRSFGTGNENGDPETLKTRRMRVGNLIYKGQLISGHILDNSKAPMLTIRNSPLKTKKLTAKQLVTPQDFRNSSGAQTLPEEASECLVRHLRVEQINGVQWKDFLNSLFLRSRDTAIKGRLVMQSRTRVNSLKTPLLNGLVVDRLFNLRRAQTINSNIYMSAFFAPRLEAQRVNGLDFAQDVLHRGSTDPWIKTPVRINQMSVSGDIQVGNTSKWQPQSRQLEEPMEQRLQQYYTGRVTIRGSLTVKNILRDTANSLIVLGNQSLARQDIQSTYLLDQTPQNISNLTFGHARVSVPSLTTSYIEGHPVRDHLLSGGQQNKHTHPNRTLHLIFMNATIQGDVICRDYSSRLAEIAKDAVRHGEVANITGHKHFQAPLTVQALQTNEINGVPVSQLVLKSNTAQNFTGTKTFARVVVANDIHVHDHLNASHLNGLPLQQLLGHDISLQRLELTETPHLENLNFRRLNGLPFDELLSKISEDGEQPLLLHKQLLIEGNVRFEKALQVQSINGIQWDEYLGRLVRSDSNAEIRGQKTFMADVQINDALRTPHINNMDLSSLLDNTLLRTTPQQISGSYTFDRMMATNVDVNRINGVPKEEFIDTRKDVELKGDLYLKQLNINGSLKCPLVHEAVFKDLEQRVEQVQQLPWRNLIVTGDALWDGEEQTQSQLDYLRQHAVRRDGNQTIAGHVLLKAPYLMNIQSKQPLPVELNFTHLAEDALLRRSPTNETQVITAPQELLGSVTAHTLHLEKDAHFGLINGIDIRRFNASLYRLSSGEAIAADLHFLQAPKIGKLQLDYPEVNGAPIESIFQQGKGQSWPPVTFKNLLVEQDLNLKSVNNMNLDYLLQNRIPLKGDALEVFGSLTFQHLQLGGKPLLRSINGIQLDNLVFRHSNRTQSITGAKTFRGGVAFTGPGHVMNLNGRELSESFRGSIFRNRDYNIDSLVLDKALFPGGLVLAGLQSQIPNRMRAMEVPSNSLEELQALLALGNQSTSRRLLYLDHDTETLESTWVKAPLRGSPELQVSLPLGDSAPCQRRTLQAQLRIPERRVLLANSSVSNQLMRLHSGDIRVKVQNHCHRPARRLRSRIRISCRNETHTLGMRQAVEAMDLLEMGEMVLLLLGTEEEVRVLRLRRSNCSLTDWQSVLPADGRLMKLIRMGMGRRQDLILTSAMSKHRPVLAIHARDPLNHNFKVLQLIQGSYDLAEMQGSQLLASCLGCRHIAIFNRNSQSEETHFEPIQQLSFQERIQQLTPFKVGDQQYLLVVTQPEEEHFYLFSYNPVGGWQQRTFGIKKQGQWAWSLIKSGQILESDETPILLLCGKQRECSLVKALLG